jgi:hypothetical protein
VVEFAKKNFQTDYDALIKPMADYSLQLAQIVGADPVVCMISSLLHKLADKTIGEFRSNKVNAVLREFGFNATLIEAINNCVKNFIPSHQQMQESIEEKVVGDAYILTYWKELSNSDYKFNFFQSEQIFHNIDK